MLLVENAWDFPGVEGVITDDGDPLLRAVACTGAPACPQAHAETRPLARALAPHMPATGILHISGCAKGCAHPKAASHTITATEDGFDLIRDGRAGDAPCRTALTSDELTEAL